MFAAARRSTQPLGVTKMRLAIALGLLFAASEASAADAVIVRGEVSWTANGIARISECGTGRALEFGTMASSPYFRFKRRYEELSADGKTPVLVEVEGVLVRSGNSINLLTIQHPRVLGLTKGACDFIGIK